MSEDRWVYPATGETSVDIDHELTDAEVVARRQRDRSVTHRQAREGLQGLSSDSPGTDPATRQHTGEQTSERSGAHRSAGEEPR